MAEGAQGSGLLSQAESGAESHLQIRGNGRQERRNHLAGTGRMGLSGAALPSLSAMQNDCRNYNWTLKQYREISAEGLAGEWIALETPALDEM